MAFCRLCGARVDDGKDICLHCEQKSSPPNNQNQPQSSYTQPTQNANYYQSINLIPPEYAPLGAWTYFGYSLLFMIPVVGFILMIVFSFSNDNINRRNYARSFFCIYAVIGIALLLGVASIGAIFA